MLLDSASFLGNLLSLMTAALLLKKYFTNARREVRCCKIDGWAYLPERR